MTQATLVTRLNTLETELAAIRKQLNGLTTSKDWRATIGMFAGDEIMKQIDAEGQKLRQKDRERAARHLQTQKASVRVIVLDTDHVTVLRYPEHAHYERLRQRMDAAGETFAVTIVTVEEQMRGWLGYIHRFKDFHKQLPGYERLGKMIDFFAHWTVLPFDVRAAEVCDERRGQKLRLGTMDLKIAAITLVHGALLLSGNLRDFRKVRDLRVQSWLD